MGKPSQSSSISSGSWVVFWDPDQGDYRGISFSDLATALQAALAVGRPEADTQYSAPSATGFSVTIAGIDADNDVHLILTPVAGYAAGTIVLPAVAGLRDKQEVTVNCTQAVAALTVSGNGATAVTGAPTALTANAFFKMCYDLITKTWYRIG
jgi:hypothetical protein